MKPPSRSSVLSNGKSAAIVLAILAAAAQVSVACSSEVTVDTGGSAGSGGHAGSGGSGASAAGGASTGGASTGGVAAGGASTGGASVGGSTGDAGSTGDGGSMTVCPGYGDACTECFSYNCSETWCACDAEPHCLGYLQCLGTCAQGDAACYQNCATVHEAGISKAVLVSDCAATTCDADCAFGKELTPCQHCLYTDCSSEMNACIADAECLALVQCYQACAPGDMACYQVCQTDHPDGITLAVSLGACRNTTCSAACP